MGYVEDNILSDEEVLAEANHRLMAFIFPAAFIAAGFAIPSLFDVSKAFGFILMGYGAYKLYQIVSTLLTDELAMTDQRVIGKKGLISRDTLDLRNDSVSGFSVDQSIIGRLLGYGTIEVRGSGADTEEFDFIGKPKDFRNTIQRHLQETKQPSTAS